MENDNPYSYQSFEKDKDGTIIKRDKINNVETIIKPDGKKYILNKTTHELIVASVKEEKHKKEDKKNTNGDKNSKPTEEAKEKNDIKKPTQEVNFLKNKMAEDGTKKVILKIKKIHKMKQLIVIILVLKLLIIVKILRLKF